MLRRRLLRWAWEIAALWALAVFVGCYWGVTRGPFHNWTRDQKIAVSQSAVALAGFGAGAVALFSTASQLRSLGNPRVEVETERRIELLEPTEYPDAFASEPIAFWVVNRGEAVALAWHCQMKVAAPLSIQISGAPPDLGLDATDPYTVIFNTTLHPLFPEAPMRLGYLRVVASRAAVNALPNFAPRVDWQVVTDKGPSANSIHIHRPKHLTGETSVSIPHSASVEAAVGPAPPTEPHE